MSLNGQQMLTAVLLGPGARRNAEHHLHAGAVNIGIQQADSRALRSEGQREILAEALEFLEQLLGTGEEESESDGQGDESER